MVNGVLRIPWRLMPITVQIDTAARLIRTRFAGEITVAHLKAYNEQLRAHADFSPALRELVVLEDLRPNLDFKQLEAYRTWYRALSPVRACAIVAPDRFAYGMARQFQTLAESEACPMHVARDIASAEAWLAHIAAAAGDPPG